MEDGLQTKIGSSGVRLSGGQAQRLSLARTLCHKRPLLILDDPFSALDRKTEQEIFKNLQKETENGIVLLISHTAVPVSEAVEGHLDGTGEHGCRTP